MRARSVDFGYPRMGWVSSSGELGPTSPGLNREARLNPPIDRCARRAAQSKELAWDPQGRGGELRLGGTCLAASRYWQVFWGRRILIGQALVAECGRRG